AGGAEKFPKNSDGYGFTAVSCLQLVTLADAMNTIKGSVNEASTIAALENLNPVPIFAGPPGTLSKTKHYAGVANFLVKYSAQSQTWVPVDDAKPIMIGG